MQLANPLRATHEISRRCPWRAKARDPVKLRLQDLRYSPQNKRRLSGGHDRSQSGAASWMRGRTATRGRCARQSKLSEYFPRSRAGVRDECQRVSPLLRPPPHKPHSEIAVATGCAPTQASVRCSTCGLCRPGNTVGHAALKHDVTALVEKLLAESDPTQSARIAK